jgi:hypothetical protein
MTVPSTLRSCCYNRCNDPSHLADVDCYCNDFIRCIKYSVDLTLPLKSVDDNSFDVPGWSDFLQEKYDASRDAFLD